MTRCDAALRAAAEAWGAAEPLPDDASEHLRDCAACAREAEAFRSVLDAAASRPVPEPDAAYWDGFDARLRARLRAERGSAGASRRTGRLAAGFPAAVPLRVAALAAAALVPLAAALALLWRAAPPPAPAGTDIAERVQSEIAGAGTEDREALFELFAIGDLEDADAHGSGDALDPDAAGDALLQITALLAPADPPALAEIDEELDGVSGDALRRILESIDEPDTPPAATQGGMEEG